MGRNGSIGKVGREGTHAPPVDLYRRMVKFSTLNNFLIWSPGINMIVSTPTKSTILRRTVFKWIFYLLRSPRYGYRKNTIIQRNTVISKNAIERKLFMLEPQKQR